MIDTSGTGLPVRLSGTDDAGRAIHTLNVSDAPGDSITVAVCLLFEAVCGPEMLERRPIASSIDTDALDTVFHPSDGEPPDARVTFTHAGWRVRVEGGERIELVELG